MGSSSPPNRIPLLLSSRASWLLGLGELRRVAEAARLDGIDLDLSRGAGLFAGRRLALDQQTVPPLVRAVWLPPPRRSGRPVTVVGSQLETRAVALGAAVVVDLPVSPGGRLPRAAMTGVVETLRRALGSGTQVLFLLRSDRLVGGRSHLAQLSALRHLAEEWDFGVALDLAEAFDPTWEAEAAVSRLGRYLRLLRLRTDATDRFPLGRARVASRALSAALDLDQPPAVSLVPSVPFLHRLSTAALSAAVGDGAAAIRERLAAIDRQRADATFTNIEPRFHTGGFPGSG